MKLSLYHVLAVLLPCIAICVLISLKKSITAIGFVEMTTHDEPGVDLVENHYHIAGASEPQEPNSVDDQIDRNEPWALVWKQFFRGNQNQSLEKIRQASSVDYYTCCGLGHRLSKNADAYYVASRKLNFSLRTNWGTCDDTEVHQYLFGPQPPSSLPFNTSIGLTVRLQNNVYGFKKLIRSGDEESCEANCLDDKFNSDLEYFQSLAERFRMKRKVDDFVKQHRFHEHTVLGMHIRAGNNETGNFAQKNRGIREPEKWVNNVVSQLLNLTQRQLPKPPLLYVATDTPKMVSMLNESLKNIMPVIEYHQRRPPEGTGVLFGTTAKNSGSDCLTGWEDATMDIMLLGRSDIAIAARPSSFIQTLPLTFALSRGENVTTPSYCEFDYNATSMRCFQSFHDWCCHGTSDFSMNGFSIKYESRHVPLGSYNYSILSRPHNFPMQPLKYLPYDYPQ